jgi:hypothetical protein
VSPVKYELGSYIPEDGILHSHRRDNLKPYTVSLLEFRMTLEGRQKWDTEICKAATRVLGY